MHLQYIAVQLHVGIWIESEKMWNKFFYLWEDFSFNIVKLTYKKSNIPDSIVHNVSYTQFVRYMTCYFEFSHFQDLYFCFRTMHNGPGVFKIPYMTSWFLFYFIIHIRVYILICTLGCYKMHLFPWNIPWPGAKESFSDVGFENIFVF